MAKKAIAEPQIKYTAVCVNCGTFIPENKGLVRENKHYCETCSILTPAVKAPVSIMPPAGPLKILSYIASLTPLAGFIFGAIYYPQEGPEAKKFGKNCFIMMLIGLGIGLMFFILMLAAGSLLGNAAGGFNFGEGYY